MASHSITGEDFGGRHWETGSVHNALALQGALAPHTGQPYGEALLLGISGGIAFGYFIFEYEGYLPHVALLTRNTFDPLDTLFDRLALPREVQQTTSAETGQANLIAALEAGRTPLVWADWLTLPHNALGSQAHNWGMLPLVVYGFDGNAFLVADRSRRGLRLTAAELAAARERVKKDRHRLLALEAPDPKHLPSAVQKGIWNVISLFTETPPKGAKDNFGFAAYQKWARMLVNERNKQSWARVFPPGERLYNALAGTPDQPGLYQWVMTWGAGPGAERGVYADFLDEAAAILKRPGLKEVAGQFRQSEAAWRELAQAALPDSVPPLAEARMLLQRRHDLFIERGGEALEEMRGIHARLDEIKQLVKMDFPLSDEDTVALRATLRDHILKIHDIELAAVEAFQSIMA